jgi:hypothetical protein
MSLREPGGLGSWKNMSKFTSAERSAGSRTRYLCMGLCRFFGGLGFLAPALGLFYALKQQWGIDVQRIGEIPALGARGWALLLIPTAVGLIGILLGQLAGTAIRIRSDEASRKLNVLWHYTANGSLTWMLLSGFEVTFTFRAKPAVQAFMLRSGTLYFVSAWFVALAGCALIALIAEGRPAPPYGPDGGERSAFAGVGPLAIGILMGVGQALYWGHSTLGGALTGFALPLLVTGLSTRMWRRDQAMRFDGRS